MNVVDSSAWLEYAAGGPNAGAFRAAIHDTDRLLVPTICLYEVYKRLFAQLGEGAAQLAVGAMMEGEVIPLDAEIAIAAARLSVELRLPMADSVILATARSHQAILWTQDADFDGLPNVRFVAASPMP